MDDILNKLTDYTFALRDALERTNESSERPKIIKHLAAAAEMFALLNRHQTVDAIEHIVRAEIRGQGLSYLSGTAGEAVAKKWLAFTTATGIQL